ncbi:hypothetical protein PYW08_004597 [Mythimna loreyi]|uniref:Uncharacterized protein n=1 Tax=Mythimna loreyi TaxID=667449 RepID=A0ACC2QQB6_9NEOP|nr:hypothetical protein PYW08_004597 [Mythimna loreyi]
MCCIFTCCGWMIDLIQRAWTFTMSCIIMTAVGGVMVTASMSGIALGYNYSLAEYIDLKETNVSVYLKRGVFDDEVADDMDWRRAGHLPVQGQLKDENLRTGAPADDDSTTLRSGRRLDDSVFEADDQNKYEGSLMKLTAKPVHLDTASPSVTDDTEMADTLSKFSLEPLDHMKAIQSLIDSRRAMATAGSTLTPVAGYENAGPILAYLPSNNNPNIPMHPETQYRRMMAPGPGSVHITLSPLNPARLAVPDPSNLESAIDWLGPKQPGIFVQSKLPEFFVHSPTYPKPVTVAPATLRPGPLTPDGRRQPGSINFPYPYNPQRAVLTPPPPTRLAGLNDLDKPPDFYNEKILAEGNEISKNEDMINKPPKWGTKTPEEEYEDEIKGLPVRRRRSISPLVTQERKPEEKNVIRPVAKESPKSINFFTLVKSYFNTALQLISNSEDNNYGNNTTTNKNQSKVKIINDTQIENSTIDKDDLEINVTTKDTIKQQVTGKHNSNLVSKAEIIPERDLNEAGKTSIDQEINIPDKETIKQQMDITEKRDSNLISVAKIIPDHDLSETGKTLLDHLVKSTRAKEAILAAETTPKTDIASSPAKKIRIKTIRKSFESKIVSSKYGANDLAKRLKKKGLMSNQELLNSISVGLNEAGLLRDPESSPLVKLLQATLTA